MRRALLDENISHRIGEGLRSAGWDVVFAAVISPGAADTDILSESVRSERIIVTRDRDYGELIFGKLESAFGVVYIRRRPDEQIDGELVAAMSLAKGQYVTLDAAGVRKRLLPNAKP